MYNTTIVCVLHTAFHKRFSYDRASTLTTVPLSKRARISPSGLPRCSSRLSVSIGAQALLRRGGNTQTDPKDVRFWGAPKGVLLQNILSMQQGNEVLESGLGGFYYTLESHPHFPGKQLSYDHFLFFSLSACEAVVIIKPQRGLTLFFPHTCIEGKQRERKKGRSFHFYGGKESSALSSCRVLSAERKRDSFLISLFSRQIRIIYENQRLACIKKVSQGAFRNYKRQGFLLYVYTGAELIHV